MREESVSVNENEVLYVGAYMKDRIQSLIRVVDALSQYNLTLNINLFYGRKTPPISHPHLSFISKGISYAENLKITKKAAVILDIKTVEHNGLSLRIFEAIKYQKKLITDNKSIMQYDFYHPNNFYVIEDDHFQGLAAFLNSQYIPLAEEIKQKYSFSNWLKYVLDIPLYK